MEKGEDRSCAASQGQQQDLTTMGIREDDAVSIGAVSQTDHIPSSSDSTPNATQGRFVENATSPKHAISMLLGYFSSFLGHDQRLASRTSTCILVNFISVGYILLPFGKYLNLLSCNAFVLASS
jgi:hypothetical protein